MKVGITTIFQQCALFAKRRLELEQKIVYSERGTCSKLERFSRWWFHPYFLFSPLSLGKWSNLTIFFKMGWNHQPVFLFLLPTGISFSFSSFSAPAKVDGDEDFRWSSESWIGNLCKFVWLVTLHWSYQGVLQLFLWTKSNIWMNWSMGLLNFWGTDLSYPKW